MQGEDTSIACAAAVDRPGARDYDCKHGTFRPSHAKVSAADALALVSSVRAGSREYAAVPVLPTLKRAVARGPVGGMHKVRG